MLPKRSHEILILIVICLLAFWLRSFFFEVPLERDEGAYGYIAQQWLINGLIPYKDILEEKPILVYLIYMLPLKLFGVNSYIGIRIFTAFYAILILLALYLTTRRIYGYWPAFWASLFYAYFSAAPRVHGFGSNTEIFLNLPLIIGLYCFWVGEERGRPAMAAFLSGLFCGIGFLIRQTAIFHLMALIIYLWYSRRFFRYPGICLLGFLLPLTVTAGYFASQGLLYSLFAHTIISIIGRVAGDYSATVFIKHQYLEMIINRLAWILGENLVLWLISFSMITRFLVSERLPKNILLLIWFLFSFIGVASSGRFYGHHFIEIIPILCLLAGYGLNRIFVNSFGLTRNFVVTAIISCSLLGLAVNYNYYFKFNQDEISKAVYFTSDFAESVRLGRYINQRTSPQDYIYVWGASPQICFYAQRKSVSQFVNYYSIFFVADAEEVLGQGLKRLLWAHLSDRQEGEMKRLELLKPKYIILSAPLEVDQRYPITRFLAQMLQRDYIFEGKMGDQYKYGLFRLKGNTDTGHL